jgi:hypothetical protein
MNMNIMLEEGSNYSRLLFDNFELFKKFMLFFLVSILLDTFIKVLFVICKFIYPISSNIL